MAYTDTAQKILDTLTGRLAGSQITPDTHQAMAETLLEYIKEVENISGSPLIGFADEDTTPVLPDNAFCSYISCVAANSSMTYKNFYNQNGENIALTAPNGTSYFVILFWNKNFWSYTLIPIAVTNVKVVQTTGSSTTDVLSQKGVTDAINAEASNRQSADEAIQKSIEQETSDRKAEDETLQKSISDEAEKRKTADDDLSTKIEKEATQRTEQDSKLQENINSEIEGRMSGDKSIQDTLTQEIEDRKGRDDDLQEQLNEYVNGNFATQLEKVENAVAEVQKSAEESKEAIAELVNGLDVTQTTGDSETSVMSQKAVTDELSTVNLSSDGNTYNGVLKAAVACADRAGVGKHIVYNDDNNGLVEYAYLGSTADDWSKDASKWSAVSTGQDSISNGILSKHVMFNSTAIAQYHQHYGNAKAGENGEVICTLSANSTCTTSITIPDGLSVGDYTCEVRLKASEAMTMNFGKASSWGSTPTDAQSLEVGTEESTIKFSFQCETTGYKMINIQTTATSTEARTLTIYSCRIWEGAMEVDLWGNDDRVVELEKAVSERNEMWEDVTPKYDSHYLYKTDPTVGGTLDTTTQYGGDNHRYELDVNEGEVYRLYNVCAYYHSPVFLLDKDNVCLDKYTGHSLSSYTAKEEEYAKYRGLYFQLTMPTGCVKMVVTYYTSIGTAKIYKANARGLAQLALEDNPPRNYSWLEKIDFRWVLKIN